MCAWRGASARKGASETLPFAFAVSIVARLKARPFGTFCFYGPAGSGKSELAWHFADEIGKPMLVRRAYDILSMLVGGSEKNFARMFAEARQQDARLSRRDRSPIPDCLSRGHATLRA